MSNIEVVLGGKGVGIADQASIDPMVGCRNMCVGCYASKTSRLGKSFFKDEPILKEFNNDVFIKSCKAAVRKGINIARLGKHCDPGDPICIGTSKLVNSGCPQFAVTGRHAACECPARISQPGPRQGRL